MKNYSGNDEDRNSAMTRFILIYIITILFALIPLYYLFNIPGKTIRNLKVSAFSSKSEVKKIERINEIMKELDKNLQEAKFEKEYRQGVDDLFRFVKDSIPTNNVYRPVLIKISDLYEKIGKTYLEGGKAELEKLREEKKDLEEEAKELKEKNDDLKLEKMSLELQLKQK